MKLPRRSFLKGLASVAVVPVAAKLATPAQAFEKIKYETEGEGAFRIRDDHSCPAMIVGEDGNIHFFYGEGYKTVRTYNPKTGKWHN